VRIFRAKKTGRGGGAMPPPSRRPRASPSRRISASPAPRRASPPNFTKLGFHPGFGLTTSFRNWSKNNAELIFYTSRRVTGEEATRMGLANVCVPQDQVRAEAMKLAAEISECSPLGLLSNPRHHARRPRRPRAGRDHHELAEQSACARRKHFKEGVRATADAGWRISRGVNFLPFSLVGEGGVLWSALRS